MAHSIHLWHEAWYLVQWCPIMMNTVHSSIQNDNEISLSHLFLFFIVTRSTMSYKPMPLISEPTKYRVHEHYISNQFILYLLYYLICSVGALLRSTPILSTLLFIRIWVSVIPFIHESYFSMAMYFWFMLPRIPSHIISTLRIQCGRDMSPWGAQGLMILQTLTKVLFADIVTVL